MSENGFGIIGKTGLQSTALSVAKTSIKSIPRAFKRLNFIKIIDF